jgi:hypothetical protein
LHYLQSNQSFFIYSDIDEVQISAIGIIIFFCHFSVKGQFSRQITAHASSQFNEDIVLKKILQLPEVKKRISDVKKRSKGKRHLKFAIWQKPTAKENYYWVKVIEDNGVAYHTHFNFFVDSINLAIRYFDTSTDKAITLSEWRNSLKNEI